MNYREKYQMWLEKVPAEDPLHEELVALAGDEALMKEKFVNDMTFGTAGLRGILGVGTNCMNVYTVGRATQGIADFICEKGEEAKGLCISGSEADSGTCLPDPCARHGVRNQYHGVP